MARRYVFDAGALSLAKDGDPRLRPFLEEVARGQVEGLVVDLTLTELQYKICQSHGERAADTEGRRIRSSAMRLIRNSLYLDLAWRLKCRYRGRFSLADCVVLAVAQVHAGRVVTTDSAFANLHEPRVTAHVLPVPDSPNP